MDITHVLIAIVAVGLGLHLVNTYIPMAEPTKSIFNVVVLLLLCLWLLGVSGLTTIRIR